MTTVEPDATGANGGMEYLLRGVDVHDPYPLWQSLLDAAPVVAPDGSSALLSRHADCDAVLRSHRSSTTDDPGQMSQDR